MRGEAATMRQVLKLTVDTWDAQTRDWGQSHLDRPTWPQVEASIRALDPVARPILTIHFNEEGELENDLWIQGGNGKYTVGGTSGNGRWVQYRDENVDDTSCGMTTVVTADQGRTAWEGLVCKCTELVVRIARCFVEHNAFLPDAVWEVTSEPEEPPVEEVRETVAGLPAAQRVTFSFQRGPLGGIVLDSHSPNESERWDVAWLMVKTLGGRIGERFSAAHQFQSQSGRVDDGEYEIRSGGWNDEERWLFLFFSPVPGAADAKTGMKPNSK
jgi:hypothetical protein